MLQALNPLIQTVNQVDPLIDAEPEPRVNTFLILGLREDAAYSHAVRVAGELLHGGCRV